MLQAAVLGPAASLCQGGQHLFFGLRLVSGMPRRRRVPDRRLRLRVSARARWTCLVLNVLPLPGVGAALLGWRNPHTGLLRRGLMQLTLVLFGSWPLVVPGAIGLAWAAYDAVRIGQARLLPLPPWPEHEAATSQAAPTKAGRP